MESFDELFLWLATAADRYCLLSNSRAEVRCPDRRLPACRVIQSTNDQQKDLGHERR